MSRRKDDFGGKGYDYGQSGQHSSQQGRSETPGKEPRATEAVVENAGQGSGGSKPLPEGVEGDTSTQTGAARSGILADDAPTPGSPSTSPASGGGETGDDPDD